MASNDDVLVVVPMFNEEPRIGPVLDDLGRSFARVLCVDDGSADLCAEVARAHGAGVVRHPINLGQGAALQTGFAFALSDPSVRFVVTFDADGQHQVEDAVAMVDRARRGDADVILGSRFLQAASEVPPLRRAVLRAAVAFTRLTSRLDVTDTHNGLRVLSRYAVSRVNLTLNGMSHASQILDQIAGADLSYAEHPVTIRYSAECRAKGQSNLNAVNIVLDVLGQRLRGVR